MSWRRIWTSDGADLAADIEDRGVVVRIYEPRGDEDADTLAPATFWTVRDVSDLYAAVRRASVEARMTGHGDGEAGA